MSSPVVDALRALASALEGVGAGWYLFGAQAALMYGSRRLTADIDVTVLPAGKSPKEIATHLERHGFELRVPDADDFVTRTRVLPIVHVATNMPVDVVWGGPGLEELFWESSQAVDMGGVLIPVATAEHLIVMKLLAGRPKDLDDCAAIARGTDVDVSSIEELVETIAVGLGEDDIRAALAEFHRLRLRGR